MGRRKLTGRVQPARSIKGVRSMDYFATPSTPAEAGGCQRRLLSASTSVRTRPGKTGSPQAPLKAFRQEIDLRYTALGDQTEQDLVGDPRRLDQGGVHEEIGNEQEGSICLYVKRLCVLLIRKFVFCGTWK